MENHVTGFVLADPTNIQMRMFTFTVCQHTDKQIFFIQTLLFLEPFARLSLAFSSL